MRKAAVFISLCLMAAMPMPANGQTLPYGSAEIRNACSSAIPMDLPSDAVSYLHSSANAVVSLPKLSCIAVLFDKEIASSMDRISVQTPAEDGSYFVTASIRPGRLGESPHYTFAQTPFDGSRWVPGVGIGFVRWEFESPFYRIEDGDTLTFRRFQTIPAGVSEELTIHVVHAFPILDKETVVDRLFLIVIDKVPSEAARRPSTHWVLYSERANTVIHRFGTMFTIGHHGPLALRRVARIIYFDGDRMDLTIERDQLQDLLAFTHDFVAADR